MGNIIKIIMEKLIGWWICCIRRLKKSRNEFSIISFIFVVVPLFASFFNFNHLRVIIIFYLLFAYFILYIGYQMEGKKYGKKKRDKNK